MGGKNAIIGILAVLTVLLGGVAIWENIQLSAVAQAASAEKAQSVELQKKVESLEQEIATLKETADYYFKSGIDHQSAGNLQEAKTAFEAVVAKFPTSSLVGSAQQRLAAVDEAITNEAAAMAAEQKKAEADRLAEEQRQQAEQEKLAREQGEPIDYNVFYAKVKSETLPIGKRFRFVAVITHDLNLSQQDAQGGKALYYEAAAFDDQTQYEQFLQHDDFHQNSDGLRVAGTIHTIVASMGSNGWVQIYRIE